MATSSVKNGAKITTSGDWTWTEFENGMIVAEANVNLGDNIQITDASYGNFVSPSLSVTTPTTVYLVPLRETVSPTQSA